MNGALQIIVKKFCDEQLFDTFRQFLQPADLDDISKWVTVEKPFVVVPRFPRFALEGSVDKPGQSVGHAHVATASSSANVTVSTAASQSVPEVIPTAGIPVGCGWGTW